MKAQFRWGSPEDAWYQKPDAAFDRVNALLKEARKLSLYEFFDGTLQHLCIEVLKELDVSGLPVVAIAKGADRRPGQERLFVTQHAEPVVLAPESPVLHLVQRVRDEAHRFAITGHRKRRARRHKTINAC